MYYKRLTAEMTGFDPLVVIEADNPRDEVVEQQVKIEEVMDNDKDAKSVRSEVSRALSSLEQEVPRSDRTVRQTTAYNSITRISRGD